MCMMFGLLCSALALAALTLAELSGHLNQAILQQRIQTLSRHAPVTSVLETLPVACPGQFQTWPAEWLQCQLQRPTRQTLAAGPDVQIILRWQIDPQTQGGEL